MHYQQPDHFFEGKAGAMEPEAIARCFNIISGYGRAVIPCKCCLDKGHIVSVEECEDHNPDETPWRMILMNEYVGDGDATTAQHISVHYTLCVVKHRRCKNHAVKNVGSHMYQLVSTDDGKNLAKPAMCGAVALTPQFIRNVSTTAST